MTSESLAWISGFVTRVLLGSRSKPAFINLLLFSLFALAGNYRRRTLAVVAVVACAIKSHKTVNASLCACG
jgi:hypothetical protein